MSKYEKKKFELMKNTFRIPTNINLTPLLLAILFLFSFYSKRLVTQKFYCIILFIVYYRTVRIDSTPFQNPHADLVTLET